MCLCVFVLRAYFAGDDAFRNNDRGEKRQELLGLCPLAVCDPRALCAERRTRWRILAFSPTFPSINARTFLVWAGKRDIKAYFQTIRSRRGRKCWQDSGDARTTP